MKKTVTLLAIAILIVTGCVVYLLINGIGLRSAALIRPSIISAQYQNIPHSLVYRLFQEFQNADYVIWGLSEDEKLNQHLIKEIQLEYEKLFKKTVSVIHMTEKTANSFTSLVQSCHRPCWIFTPFDKANQLSKNSFVELNATIFSNNYFTLTLIKYDRNMIVNERCENQKRLDLECLTSLSIREVRRKLKLEDEKYFFLRKYNDSDYFLFIEN